MSSNPFTGAYAVRTSDWGNATLDWGVSIGGYILILGAILTIAGGIADIIIGRKSDKQIDKKLLVHQYTNYSLIPELIQVKDSSMLMK